MGPTIWGYTTWQFTGTSLYGTTCTFLLFVCVLNLHFFYLFLSFFPVVRQTVNWSHRLAQTHSHPLPRILSVTRANSAENLGIKKRFTLATSATFFLLSMDHAALGVSHFTECPSYESWLTWKNCKKNLHCRTSISYENLVNHKAIGKPILKHFALFYPLFISLACQFHKYDLCLSFFLSHVRPSPSHHIEFSRCVH